MRQIDGINQISAQYVLGDTLNMKAFEDVARSILANQVIVGGIKSQDNIFFGKFVTRKKYRLD